MSKSMFSYVTTCRLGRMYESRIGWIVTKLIRKRVLLQNLLQKVNGYTWYIRSHFIKIDNLFTLGIFAAIFTQLTTFTRYIRSHFHKTDNILHFGHLQPL